MENNSSTSSFNSIWKIMLAGAATFIALNIAIAYFMRYFDAQDETVRFVNDRRLDAVQADVIFLGDSRTHQGLDPEVFAAESGKRGAALSAINLAAPGMQGPFYYFVLKDYLDYAAKPPKVVIANISFYMLGGAQWLQDIYLNYYTPTIDQAWDATLSRLLLPEDAAAWYIRTRIPALRYNKSFSGLIDTFAADPLHGLSKNRESVASVIERINDQSNRGYLSSGEKTVSDADLQRFDFDGYRLGFENGYSAYQAYFRRFFDLAADHHIHVIIYPFPWPMQASQSDKFRNAYGYYDLMTKKLAAGNPYVHFVEYDYFWTPDYFVDPLHVNQKGADRLSKMAACWASLSPSSLAKCN